MKAITIMIMALIMLPGIFASNLTGIDPDQSIGGEYNTTVGLYDNMVLVKGNLTPCERMQEYFSAVNMRLLYLVSFIFMMWLLEPAFKKKVENTEIKPNRYYTKDTLTYLYKFIGLGLMALTIILMFTIAKGL